MAETTCRRVLRGVYQSRFDSVKNEEFVKGFFSWGRVYMMDENVLLDAFSVGPED